VTGKQVFTLGCVSAADPATDYWAVREELRMYNPDYCARPHVVALNKMDLQEAAHLQDEIAAEVLTMAQKIQVSKQHMYQTLRMLCISIQAILAQLHVSNVWYWPALSHADATCLQFVKLLTAVSPGIASFAHDHLDLAQGNLGPAAQAPTTSRVVLSACMT